jgi:NADH dehydrogenase FAD-containing subunit
MKPKAKVGISVAVQEARYVAQGLRPRIEKKEVPPFQFHFRDTGFTLFTFGPFLV